MYSFIQKDDHNFLVELEPFHLGDGVEDSLNANEHRSLTLQFPHFGLREM